MIMRAGTRRHLDIAYERELDRIFLNTSRISVLEALLVLLILLILSKYVFCLCLSVWACRDVALCEVWSVANSRLYSSP
jgi:hypothetical protein